ncbi:MAG TPA: hypothetical protein VGN78_13365 [Solirubrobacteraceae bacterium]|jgi:hypothetical protein|nr:hypothetical protein [Solirubrobacteraceae bacterium]
MLETILLSLAGAALCFIAFACFALIIWAAAQDGRTAAGVRPLRSRHLGLRRRNPQPR